MQNLLKPENKHHVHFVNYDEIVDKPKKTIDDIYRFLGMTRNLNIGLKILNK